MRALPLVIAGTLLAPSGAAGDVVELLDGETIEGEVIERDLEVEVRLDFGSLTVARTDVREIRRTPSPLAELERRRRALHPDDAEAHHRLARFAEDSGLSGQARALFLRVVALQPDHKGARAALGHRKVAGVWMDEETYMASQGFLLRRGRWVSAEVARRLDEEERVEAEALAARLRPASPPAGEKALADESEGRRPGRGESRRKKRRSTEDDFPLELVWPGALYPWWYAMPPHPPMRPPAAPTPRP